MGLAMVAAGLATVLILVSPMVLAVRFLQGAIRGMRASTKEARAVGWTVNAMEAVVAVVMVMARFVPGLHVATAMRSAAGPAHLGLV